MRQISINDEADFHLGRVLMILADLDPRDRCKALDMAMEYYNRKHPDAPVVAEPGFTSRLVSDGPIERAFRKLAADAIRKGEA